MLHYMTTPGDFKQPDWDLAERVSHLSSRSALLLQKTRNSGSSLHLGGRLQPDVYRRVLTCLESKLFRCGRGKNSISGRGFCRGAVCAAAVAVSERLSRSCSRSAAIKPAGSSGALPACCRVSRIGAMDAVFSFGLVKVADEI